MKTKIVVASLFVLVSLGMAFAGGGSQSVTDAAFVTLGAPRTSGRPAWTTNTVYSLGDIAKANSGYYLVVVAGTSGAAATNAPSGRADFVDTTLTWRPVLSSARKGLFVQNDGSGVITVTFDNGVAGLKLASGGTLSWGGSDVDQNKVVIFSDASETNSVYTSEW